MVENDLAGAIVRLAEMFGLTGLVVMIAGALVGLAIWHGRRGDGPIEPQARAAYQEVLRPETASEKRAADALHRMADNVEKIERHIDLHTRSRRE